MESRPTGKLEGPGFAAPNNIDLTSFVVSHHGDHDGVFGDASKRMLQSATTPWSVRSLARHSCKYRLRDTEAIVSDEAVILLDRDNPARPEKLLSTWNEAPRRVGMLPSSCEVAINCSGHKTSRNQGFSNIPRAFR